MARLDSWRSTWRGLGVRADDHLYSTVVEQYAAPGRCYHTVQHLDECFARLSEGSVSAVRLSEIELALWFHDAVYDVHRQDNEERSAAWAESESRKAGLSIDVASRVRDLIMATKHDAVPDSADAKLLVDVDLARSIEVLAGNNRTVDTV
jgi:predicted metal-dependent HD superfamily phosphohydrolase